MIQVSLRVQAVCLRGFQHGKDDHTGVSPGLRAAEKPVLPADHNRPDRVFLLVVADYNLTMIEERAKELPLVQGVGDCLLQLACRFEYRVQPGVIMSAALNNCTAAASIFL